MAVVVEPLHIFDEMTESIVEDPVLVGYFAAVDVNVCEFEKPIIRILIKRNPEDDVEYFYIDTFTNIGVWNDHPEDEIIEEIPHPFLQHIRCLVLDHRRDGPIERVISDELWDHLNFDYNRVYIAHKRHYVEGNLPFPEGMGNPFYIDHKFEENETGTIVKVPIDDDEFPMNDQQSWFNCSTHGVKGTSQAERISRTLKDEGSHLTRELSYLLFRVEIRNRILGELEKLSYKRYIGQDKFSISFFCPPNLAGRFFEEFIFSDLHFTSESEPGSVTKNLVKLDVDQCMLLRYQGNTCPISVRVNDVTDIEHLLGKHFNIHVIKPVTYRTGAIRHYHVVAIKPVNPMLIFSFDCNLHKFSIRSDIVRRINVQQCLYLRSDSTEGQFDCMHYFNKLMGKVFTDEDDQKKYRVVFVEFNKKDFIEAETKLNIHGYKRKRGSFDPRVALQSVDLWLIVVYAICITDEDMTNEPSRWVKAAQPNEEGDIIRRMEADLFAPEDFDLATMTIKSSQVTNQESQDCVESGQISDMKVGGGVKSTSSKQSGGKSKVQKSSHLHVEELEDDDDPGSPTQGLSLAPWTPAPGAHTAAEGRSSGDDAKLRLYINSNLSRDGSEFLPEDGICARLWRALDNLPPNFSMGGFKTCVMGICDYPSYRQEDIDSAFEQVLQYDRPECRIEMQRGQRTSYINGLTESFLNYATV